MCYHDRVPCILAIFVWVKKKKKKFCFQPTGYLTSMICYLSIAEERGSLPWNRPWIVLDGWETVYL